VTTIHWVAGIWAACTVAFIAYERLVPCSDIWDPDEPGESVVVYGALSLLSPLIIIYCLFIVVIEYSRIGWRWLVGNLVCDDEKRDALLQLAEPWEPWRIDFTNPFFKKVQDIFLGPSVRGDDATDDAVQVAISAGEVLARDIRAVLEEAAVYEEMDITSALDTPLAVIDGGSGNTDPGSLLKAACVGTVAAVGFREMYMSHLAGSQKEVLHSMIARAITTWEVGQDNIGRAPSPWQGNTHLCWAPGTLMGGKKSAANKLMESFIMTGETPREENAKFFAQTILASLGLALDPCIHPPEFSVLNKLGLENGQSVLPDTVINTVAERILAVDLFWPSYLEGKELIW